MSTLILQFESPDVMAPRPWPVAINDDNIVTSGLGHDDGSRLIGFGQPRAQRVEIFAEDVRANPGAVVGMTATFANGGLFEWTYVVSGVAVSARELSTLPASVIADIRASEEDVPLIDDENGVLTLAGETYLQDTIRTAREEV